MARREINTDFWVKSMLEEAGIALTAQGGGTKEIEVALQTASKAGTGRAGYPEFCGTVKGEYLIVIEDKADLDRHLKCDDRGLIDQTTPTVQDYAVNGALFYALHLAKHTGYRKIFALGISGSEKRHRITPLFVSERGEYKELAELSTLISFAEPNIDAYYTHEVLGVETPVEKETAQILREAQALHEDLRSYGSIQDKDKPLIVSGILLALQEIETKTFSIEMLSGDQVGKTDGQKLYDAIDANLRRARVSPQTKLDLVLNQFSVIRDTKVINEVHPALGKTPLRHYTEFLYKSIYQSLRYGQSAEDYLGRFYGEFMSYSGGDGQSLGIVLTPRHITELFCQLVAIKPTDRVLDPCCGTGGFLIAAMHRMLQQASTERERREIRQNSLHGIESQSYMFTIATTNMILRGDGKSNLDNEDFLKCRPEQLQLKGCNVGMMNPPYSQGTKQTPSLYEINFTEHLLNSITKGGRVVVIIPQSALTGKTREEQAVKESILKHHTLEGVITLNKNTFYGVGTNPCIAVFTAGVPHDFEYQECKFINFEDDGYRVAKHVGLLETSAAQDRLQLLLDVWHNRVTEYESRFCVKTTIEAKDEWLHAFYYFDDSIPSAEAFTQTMADYLSFQFTMLTHGRGYLFDNAEEDSKPEGDPFMSAYMRQEEARLLAQTLPRLERQLADGRTEPIELPSRPWRAYRLLDLFEARRGNQNHMAALAPGFTPLISAKKWNNGVKDFVEEGSKGLFPRHCITLNNDGDGGAGLAFYQPFAAAVDSHVTVLLPRERVGRGALLFAVRCISAQRAKYGHGYSISRDRLRGFRLMLPAGEDGNPNWDFMEAYMRREELEGLARGVGYFKGKRK
ncbi:MAG: N-6 DNA methylase [Bacteroides sp.]